MKDVVLIIKILLKLYWWLHSGQDWSALNVADIADFLKFALLLRRWLRMLHKRWKEHQTKQGKEDS